MDNNRKLFCWKRYKKKEWDSGAKWAKSLKNRVILGKKSCIYIL